MVYIAGLSYVNIRAERQERAMRIAVCHAWKMIGFALVLTLYLFFLDENGVAIDGTLSNFNRTIGYIIIGSSGIFVLLMLLNEFRQRQGLLYNYRDCLDHDNAIANNYCKLFSKNEVLIERNPTVSAAGLWKSTENLLPRNKKNFTNYWTLLLMLPKLHGAILFHYFTVTIAFAASAEYVDWYYSRGIVVWIMAFGAVVGCFWLRLMHNAKVFTISSIVALIALGVSFVFQRTSNPVISICYWIFFLAASMATSVPDGALMEISKIRFSEGALAVGFFWEIIPIAVLQSLQREAHLQGEEYTDKYFLAVMISSIVILLIASMLYQLFMPNTHNKSLLQIQNELLKYKKFFAFDFDKDVNPPVPRRSSESNHYLVNSTVNVFDDHARTMSQAGMRNDEVINASPPSKARNGQVRYVPSSRMPVEQARSVSESRVRTPTEDYAEVIKPPTNFNYSSDIPKAAAIIPRVTLGRSTKSTATSVHSNGYSEYN